MKYFRPRRSIALSQTKAKVTIIRRPRLPLYLFLALCFNLVLAPLVSAATDGTLDRTQSWALGLLGLATVGLAIYLFFVMFVPEKF
jgi:K+-transporting ATPase KdpF subunit